MNLIVDTNILFSFFRENPVRNIIINSNLFGLELSTPEYAIDELWNNKSELMKYSGISIEKELENAIESLKLFVETKPINFFSKFKEDAIKISPDRKDAHFFALALKLNGVIWTNEPRLKKQSKVKILNTADLIKMLRKTNQLQ